MNECAPDPCLHGGRCSDLLGDFSCDCGGTGYSGPHCEVNIDECAASAPCMNGAACRDTDGDYSCQPCPGDFCGKNCQRRDPCQMVRFENCTSCAHIRFPPFPIGLISWEFISSPS